MSHKSVPLRLDDESEEEKESVTSASNVNAATVQVEIEIRDDVPITPPDMNKLEDKGKIRELEVEASTSTGDESNNQLPQLQVNSQNVDRRNNGQSRIRSPVILNRLIHRSVHTLNVVIGKEKLGSASSSSSMPTSPTRPAHATSSNKKLPTRTVTLFLRLLNKRVLQKIWFWLFVAVLTIAEPIVIAYYPTGRAGITAQTLLLAGLTICFVAQVSVEFDVHINGHPNDPANNFASTSKSLSADEQGRGGVREVVVNKQSSKEHENNTSKQKQSKPPHLDRGGRSVQDDPTYTHRYMMTSLPLLGDSVLVEIALTCVSFVHFLYHRGDYLFEFICFTVGWSCLYTHPGIAALRCFRVFRLLWYPDIDVIHDWTLQRRTQRKFLGGTLTVIVRACRFAVCSLIALSREMFTLSKATHGGFLIGFMFFYTAFVMGTALYIETSSQFPTYCSTIPACMYTMMRLTFYDGSGFDYAYHLANTDHNFLFAVVMCYLCVTSFGMLNGLVGIFGTAFTDSREVVYVGSPMTGSPSPTFDEPPHRSYGHKKKSNYNLHTFKGSNNNNTSRRSDGSQDPHFGDASGGIGMNEPPPAGKGSLFHRHSHTFYQQQPRTQSQRSGGDMGAQLLLVNLVSELTRTHQSLVKRLTRMEKEIRQIRTHLQTQAQVTTSSSAATAATAATTPIAMGNTRRASKSAKRWFRGLRSPGRRTTTNTRNNQPQTNNATADLDDLSSHGSGGRGSAGTPSPPKRSSTESAFQRLTSFFIGRPAAYAQAQSQAQAQMPTSARGRRSSPSSPLSALSEGDIDEVYLDIGELDTHITPRRRQEQLPEQQQTTQTPRNSSMGSYHHPTLFDSQQRNNSCNRQSLSPMDSMGSDDFSVSLSAVNVVVTPQKGNPVDMDV